MTKYIYKDTCKVCGMVNYEGKMCWHFGKVHMVCETIALRSWLSRLLFFWWKEDNSRAEKTKEFYWWNR